MRHTDASECPLCYEKLFTAHPTLASWFRRLKKRYPSAHISWSYRGPEDQAQAVRDGRSHALYPTSPHNAKQDGKPCSRALDLFQIDDDGVARFAYPFYEQISKDNERDHEPIIWGGTFKSIGDACHFELKKQPAGSAANSVVPNHNER